MSILNIFSAFGLSASAGLNAYIPLLIVALLARFTNLIQLSKPWDALTSWWAIGILVVLSIIEFFADKIPAINHVNDLIQTIIRPAAGAILFAANAHAITNTDPILSLALGLLVSGSVHTVKSVAIRPAVTATTAGVGNVPVSMLEDFISTVVSLLSVIVPIIVGVIVVLLIAWVIWWYARRKNKQVKSQLRRSS